MIVLYGKRSGLRITASTREQRDTEWPQGDIAYKYESKDVLVQWDAHTEADHYFLTFSSAPVEVGERIQFMRVPKIPGEHAWGQLPPHHTLLVLPFVVDRILHLPEPKR